MQQITAFSLGFMKINCLGKLMKFQYKTTADQKQKQRMMKYLLSPLAHRKHWPVLCPQAKPF